MNEQTCKRCGADILVGPHATNKKFCSTACYSAWWNEQRFVSATQEDRITAQLGPVPDLELTDMQAMWLATVLDCEGTVGIHRQHKNNSPVWFYRPTVEFSNTHKGFIAEIAAVSGGTAYMKTLPKLHHKPCYSVIIKKRMIPKLLERLMPYIIIKRTQADLVLEFCRAVAASPVHNRAMHPEFERLYFKCKALNKRGTK